MNIYIYQLEDRPDLYKIGQTHRDIDERIAEQVGHLPIKYTILYKEKIDGVTDYDIMAELESQGITSTFRNEWYNCSYDKIVEAIKICKKRVKPEKKAKESTNILLTLFIAFGTIYITLSKKEMLFSIALLPITYIKRVIYLRKIYYSPKDELFKIIKDIIKAPYTILNCTKISVLAFVVLLLEILIIAKCLTI